MPWVIRVNMPIGLLHLVLKKPVLRNSQGRGRRGRIDEYCGFRIPAGGPWKPRYDQPTLGPVLPHGFGALGLWVLSGCLAAQRFRRLCAASCRGMVVSTAVLKSSCRISDQERNYGQLIQKLVTGASIE